MRIVSLTPSATEIVCLLGLSEQLVGVSHECDFPEFVRGLPRLTQSLIPATASSGEIDECVRDRVQSQQSLYSLNSELLARLQPGLIVTQSLCHVCAVAADEVADAVNSLSVQPKIVNLSPSCFADLYHCIRAVGIAAGVEEASETAIQSMEDRVASITAQSSRIASRPRVVHLEWIDPLFCSGHWSPELIRLAGGHEGIGREGQLSRTIEWDEVRAFDPEVLLVACCGFDIQRGLQELRILQRLPGFSDLTCVRRARVYVTDGNAYFNRPGPRLIDSLQIAAHAIHPELHALPPQLQASLVKMN